MAFNDNFEQTLKDFFFVNHPRKSKLIPQMVKEFAGNEKEIMMLLCKKYNVSPSTIAGLSTSTPIPTPVIEAVIETAETEEEVVATEEDTTNEEGTDEVPAKETDTEEEEKK